MSASIEATINDDTNLFKIGAVSRTTNIPVDTLRIWERRYSVVVPIRSDNSDRLYRREDINRLTLLKMLVDRGHSIGSIAKLSNDKLVERLEIHDQAVNKPSSENTDDKIHVVVVGEVLSLQLEYAKINDSGFCFTGLYRNRQEFDDKNNDKNIDILVLEYPAIQEDQIDDINRIFEDSGAKKLIVIYGFTNSAAKKLLKQTEYVFIHAPITIDHIHAEIKHLIEEQHLYKQPSLTSGVELNNKAPARIYSNKSLIALSSASSTIKCECPQHLSTLVLKMVQFEIYCAECENRTKEDAEIHAMLGNMTGHARSILEKALTTVAEREGLPVS